MNKLRISVVKYLNTAPLVRGFTHGPLQGKYDLSFTVPSLCADALRTGAADIAIIPAIEYQRIPNLVILPRSEEHTSELQSQSNLVCRLLLEKKNARRVPLVTGGGRGIGREVALALARGGCAVAVAARTREHVEDVSAAARRLGADALAHVLDVTDAESVTHAVTVVTDKLGAVDVLVNNAGVAESAPLLTTDPALWDRHLKVNVTGPYLLTRAALPGMLERRCGRV